MMLMVMLMIDNDGDDDEFIWVSSTFHRTNHYATVCMYTFYSIGLAIDDHDQAVPDRRSLLVNNFEISCSIQNVHNSCSFVPFLT